MRHSKRTLTVALTAATVVLASCGDDSAGNVDTAAATQAAAEHDHDESTPVAEGARRIQVTGTSFAFEPAEIHVTAGEDIAIVLTSDDILHDFTIDELNVHVAADADETAQGGLHAEQPGRYTFYCSVPGHQPAGMEGTLIVDDR